MTDRPRIPDDDLASHPDESIPALSDADRAEIEVRFQEHRAHLDRVHEKLRQDAQACARAMRSSPLFGAAENWDTIVSRSLEDYRSGRSLMDHLGADRLLDPATTGMLLAIRRGFIEETNAASTGEFVLIDMAVIAFANAMRVQSMIGNTSLILEAEMFGQPTLRAKWEKEYGGRPEDIQGLAVEEHVQRLRDRLMPMAEHFQRMAREAIEALRRQRQIPAPNVERVVPLKIDFAAPH
jgi:hypothetical protein